MVLMEISGGIGNQMFQYACGKALAIRNDDTLALDLSWYDGSSGNRKFQLDVWRTDIQICRDEKWLSLKHSTKWSRFISRWIKKIRVVREKNMQFHRIVPLLRGNLYLQGSWQSEKYFADIADEIRNEFVLQRRLSEKNLRWETRIRGALNPVALHIRRGDYVSVPANRAIYKALPIRYYKRAIDHLVQRSGSVQIFVFTNDIMWARENLSIDMPIAFVDANDEASGYADMYLMSLCRHHIIANSTFSWWGAWMSTSQDKVVISPAAWFNSDEMNRNDIVPDEWIKLEDS